MIAKYLFLIYKTQSILYGVEDAGRKCAAMGSMRCYASGDLYKPNNIFFCNSIRTM